MNAQILPFYTSKNLRNIEKRWCKDARGFSLVVLSQGAPDAELKFPPFQIIVAGAVTNVTQMQLWAFDTETETETFTWLDVAFDTHLINGKTYMTHYGAVYSPIDNTQLNSFTGDLHDPRYEFYLRLAIDGTQHYSETFKLLPHAANQFPCGDWLRVTYFGNSKDIGSLKYEGIPLFSQSILLPADVGRPTYKYKEEGEEDGKGEFFQTMRRVEKTFLFDFLAPEWICDALSLLPLHPTALCFSSRYGQFVMNDLKFVVQDWESNCYARCEITFQTDFAAVRGAG